MGSVGVECGSVGAEGVEMTGLRMISKSTTL